MEGKLEVMLDDIYELEYSSVHGKKAFFIFWKSMNLSKIKLKLIT